MSPSKGNKILTKYESPERRSYSARRPKMEQEDFNEPNSSHFARTLEAFCIGRLSSLGPGARHRLQQSRKLAVHDDKHVGDGAQGRSDHPGGLDHRRIF
jgi:hypothetical protein